MLTWIGSLLRDVNLKFQAVEISEQKQKKLLRSKLNGSGNVYYWGNPVIESALTGSGKPIKL